MLELEGLPDLPVDPTIEPDNDEVFNNSPASVSASGLSAAHRSVARNVILQGCAKLLTNRDNVHYTQGIRRWSAIDNNLKVSHGQCLVYGDCSSTYTWLLKNGLNEAGVTRDIVNGYNWRYGYTGSILSHGKVVHDLDNILVGDALVYGPGTGRHVACAIGGGYALSHGSEGGPYKVKINYRNDGLRVRRFI